MKNYFLLCETYKPSISISIQFDFQEVDQHTGSKWLIRGTTHRKDNQLQSLELPCRIF